MTSLQEPLIGGGGEPAGEVSMRSSLSRSSASEKPEALKQRKDTPFAFKHVGVGLLDLPDQLLSEIWDKQEELEKAGAAEKDEIQSEINKKHEAVDKDLEEQAKEQGQHPNDQQEVEKKLY